MESGKCHSDCIGWTSLRRIAGMRRGMVRSMVLNLGVLSHFEVTDLWVVRSASRVYDDIIKST